MANTTDDNYGIETPEQVQDQQDREYYAAQAGPYRTSASQIFSGGQRLGYALFGNPRLEQAQNTQQAIGNAVSDSDASAPDDEDGLSATLRRYKATYAAVAPINPQAALQISNKIAVLSNAQMQQRKLMAQTDLETQHAQNMDDEDKINLAQKGTMIVGSADGQKQYGQVRLFDDSGNYRPGWQKEIDQLRSDSNDPNAVAVQQDRWFANKMQLQQLKDQDALQKAQAARAAAGALGSFEDPQVESLLASMASKGIQMPTGFRSKEQMLATFKGLLAKYDGLSTDDIADLVGNGIIDFGATRKATQTGATILGRVTAASGELDAMLPIARDASAAVPRGDFVPYNQLQQMVKAGTSSPEQKRLYVATQSILNSYDMLAARGGTDAAKRAAQHQMLETADGPQAYNAALNMLETESKVARAGALGAIRAGTYGSNAQSAAGVDGGAVGPTAATAGGMSAPPEAVAALRANPTLAPQFKAKYGFLPQLGNTAPSSSGGATGSF